MQEEWRAIKDYEGWYEVSNLGRVRRIRPMSFTTDPRSGYIRLGLWRDHKRRYFSMHRLVLETFCGSIGQNEVAHHKDGVKTNNRLDNLEKVTPSENTKRAYRIGALNQQGERNNHAKLSEDEVLMIRAWAKGGIRQIKLAENFGVCPATISLIVNRKYWPHV